MAGCQHVETQRLRRLQTSSRQPGDQPHQDRHAGRQGARDGIGTKVWPGRRHQCDQTDLNPGCGCGNQGLVGAGDLARGPSRSVRQNMQTTPRSSRCANTKQALAGARTTNAAVDVRGKAVVRRSPSKIRHDRPGPARQGQVIPVSIPLGVNSQSPSCRRVGGRPCRKRAGYLRLCGPCAETRDTGARHAWNRCE